MLEEHDEQLLLDRRRRVVKRQQVREGVRVVLRAAQHAVAIQVRDHENRLRHQVVDLTDELVPLPQLGSGEVLRVAAPARPHHLLTLRLPVLLREAHHVRCLDHIESTGRVAVRIENAQPLQDRHPVSRPGRVLRQRQPHRQKAPRRPYPVVAFLHVTGLAGGSRGVRRQGLVLLQQKPHPVLRARVHLPLRVIEAHVARLARLRLARLFHREDVPRVTRVARRQAEACTPLLEGGDLCLGLQPDLVAAAAPLHPLDQRHRCPMRRGHRVHRRPRHRVFPRLELLHRLLVAHRTCLRRRYPHLRHVLRRAVVTTVTDRTAHAHLAVSAQLPVPHDPGRHLSVTIHAFLSQRRRRNARHDQRNEKDHLSHRSLLPRSFFRRIGEARPTGSLSPRERRVRHRAAGSGHVALHASSNGGACDAIQRTLAR